MTAVKPTGERRVVSAAVKLRDERVIMCVRHLDKTFFMALGVDVFASDHPYSEELANSIKGHIDGFMDNEGNFLTREEAWPIAEAQQALIDPDWQRGRLHSEHLY